ncbi:hypothetical protein Bca52824_091952 [Brassica carinata]|uniref:Pollen Ole e 1 allergen and extensin family protein n=1 Tax=Brassica carinata TaxID=52824 RepID=A0A8X7NT64_BRACI|nr:hypothetical protein Bca52824_091952 [Brassica carinata]
MEITTTFSVLFFLMPFLGISVNGQQHHIKKTRSSAVVVGTVYCDTCFNGAFSKSPNHLIPGALVAVECIDANSKPTFRQEVKTDEHGEFKAKLPFSVSKHVKKIKRCSVKLLSSSQPYCSIAASATSSSLKRLRSSKHGENTRVFSAGFFTFKPENQPEICSQKPINLRGTKPLFPDPTFPPPIQDPVPDNPLPILPILPPLLDLPLPTLPPLLPRPPQRSASLRNKKDDSLGSKNHEVLKTDSVLPLNPVRTLLPPNPLNPPSLIPPNPVTPLLPPIPIVSSPPSLPPLTLVPPTRQPVPVITPPSPRPPSFSVSLPPIFIGIPPASSSFSSHHQP